MSVATFFTGGDQNLGLFSCHSYVVAGYDSDPTSPAYGTFQLINPWGFDNPAPVPWSACKPIAFGLPWPTGTSSAAANTSTSVGCEAVKSAQATRAGILATISLPAHAPDAALVADVAGRANALTPCPSPGRRGEPYADSADADNFRRTQLRIVDTVFSRGNLP